MKRYDEYLIEQIAAAESAASLLAASKSLLQMAAQDGDSDALSRSVEPCIKKIDTLLDKQLQRSDMLKMRLQNCN